MEHSWYPPLHPPLYSNTCSNTSQTHSKPSDSAEVPVTTIINIQVAITATGPHTINYAARTDGYGDPTTSPAYMVTETITIIGGPQETVYLPIIVREYQESVWEQKQIIRMMAFWELLMVGFAEDNE